MLSLKAGVDVCVLTPQLILALMVADGVWGNMPLIITACNNGDHKGRPVQGDTVDPHYVGKAVDLRVRNIDAAARQGFYDRLRGSLGAQYVVLWESQGSDHEHFHVQFGHPVGG